MGHPPFNPASGQQLPFQRQPYPLHSSYHQQNNTYYHANPQQPAYGSQYHHPAQSQSQANGRGGYPPEDWHRAQYQSHHPMPANAYVPGTSAKGSHQATETMSPMGSEASSGASLMSPCPTGEGLEERYRADCSRGSPTAQTHSDEKSDRPESPKEILDLDSHKAASQHPSAAHMVPGLMYNHRPLHSPLQPNRAPLHHMMSQVGGMGSRGPGPRQPYSDPGCYSQRPHPHLMEALQRQQQLPYPQGQNRLYAAPQPGPHYQGMMVQRGLSPQHFVPPSQQMSMPGGSIGKHV